MEDLTRKVSLGTTIMAISYDKGVMLAADTRTSNGNYIANRTTDKITPLCDNVYILRSGSAADTQAIASYVQHFIANHQCESGEEVEVKVCAHLARGIAYPNKDMLQAGLIVAGWDSRNGPAVFAIPLGGTMLKVPYSMSGSGSTYISAWADKHWKANMSEADARAWVVRAVELATAYDGSSGGCVRLLRIDETGTKREFVTRNDLAHVYGDHPVTSVAV